MSKEADFNATHIMLRMTDPEAMEEARELAEDEIDQWGGRTLEVLEGTVMVLRELLVIAAKEGIIEADGAAAICFTMAGSAYMGSTEEKPAEVFQKMIELSGTIYNQSLSKYEAMAKTNTKPSKGEN